MHAALIGFLAAMAATSAHAQQGPIQQWVFAGGDADSGFAVEKDTMRRTGSSVTVWVEAIPKAPVANQYMGLVDYIMTQTRYDCDLSTVQTLARMIYRTDGTLAHSEATPQDPMPSPPGSVGAGITALVCDPAALNSHDTFESPTAVRDAYRAQYGS